MKIKGYILAIISAVFYGMIPLFVLPLKAVHFPMDVTLFYRFLFSSIIILGYLLIKKESLKVRTSELGILLVLGILFSLSAEFLFAAYDYLTPGIASTILFVYPVIVALIMSFVFKEKITRNTILALLITLCGIVTLSIKDGSFAINFTGLFIALGSALSYALYMVTVNKARLNVSGFKLTFYSLLFSAMFYLAKSLIMGESLAVHHPGVLAHIALFGLITSVISISALVYAIRLIGSTPTSIMGATEPVIAVGISVYLFHESLTPTLISGILLIIGGVILGIVADAHQKRRELKKRRAERVKAHLKRAESTQG